MHHKRGVLYTKLEYLGRNLGLTGALKEQAEKKLFKLDRYLREEIRAKVTSSTKKGHHKVEITVFLPGHVLWVEESTDDMYASIDIAVQALERQVRRHRIKLKKRYQNNDSTRSENLEQEKPKADEESPDGQLIRNKDFDLRSMAIDEIILQMDLLNHNFFVYLDADQDEVCVVYRRKDGNYGRIISHRP